CIIGEPSAHKQAGDQIKVGRRGSLTGSITFFGEQGHVAYPHLAQNPIKTAAAFVSLMEHTALDHGTDVFDPSHLEFTSFDVGNATSNLIPGRATLRFALRFNPLHTEDSLKDFLREKIESLTNTYSMETTLNGVPFYHNNPDAVDRISRSIERITGQKPTPSTSGGTSDGRFIASLCPVIECGFSNETIHKANERVSLEDFNVLTEIYDAILKDFFA